MKRFAIVCVSNVHVKHFITVCVFCNINKAFLDLLTYLLTNICHNQMCQRRLCFHLGFLEPFIESTIHHPIIHPHVQPSHPSMYPFIHLSYIHNPSSTNSSLHPSIQPHIYQFPRSFIHPFSPHGILPIFLKAATILPLLDGRRIAGGAHC